MVLESSYLLFSDHFRICRGFSILGDPGAVSGAEDKVKTGGKKFNEQKYERKIGARSYFSFVFSTINSDIVEKEKKE